MRNDPPAAAVRLAAALPCRTHRHVIPVVVQGSKRPAKVLIGAQLYNSVAHAARELGKSRGAIRSMIQRNQASYA